MGQLHIANFYDCDRLSAVAGEAGLVPGMVVKVGDNGAGERSLTKLGDGEAAQALAGKVAVITKELIDPDEVVSSTAPSEAGSRIVSIASGDAVLELRRGAKLEYPLDLLHSSLDPSRGGTLPVVGAALGVKDSLFCASGQAGAITSPVIGRVLRVHGAGATAVVVIETVV